MAKKKKGGSNTTLFGGIGGGVVALILVLMFALPSPTYKSGMDTISDLQAFAEGKEEYPKIENEKPLKPDFSEYWQSMVPGFLSRKVGGFFYRLWLKGAPTWSVSYFAHQLEALTKQRQEGGLKGNFIQKYDVKPGDTFLMWGDLQGAMHSFTRDLVKAKELGLIDDNFKVTKPNTYIIVMGDAISRSAYSMETLSIIMRLLEQNPSNAFYMMGGHEAKNAWHGHSLKRELEVQAAHISSAKLPLGDEVSAFFDTLPRALYLGPVPPTDDDFVRVSAFGRELSEEEQVEHRRLFGQVLDEGKFAQYLVDKTQTGVTIFDLTKGQSSAEEINIKAIIKGEKKRETYQPHKGLRLMKPELGATAWTMLSSPTEPYQKILKFKYDAFCVMTVGDAAENWDITLYSQDAMTKSGYEAIAYEFFSGQAKGTEAQKAEPGDTAPETSMEEADEPEAAEEEEADDELEHPEEDEEGFEMEDDVPEQDITDVEDEEPAEEPEEDDFEPEEGDDLEESPDQGEEAEEEVEEEDDDEDEEEEASFDDDDDDEEDEEEE